MTVPIFRRPEHGVGSMVWAPYTITNNGQSVQRTWDTFLQQSNDAAHEMRKCFPGGRQRAIAEWCRPDANEINETAEPRH